MILWETYFESAQQALAEGDDAKAAELFASAHEEVESENVRDERWLRTILGWSNSLTRQGHYDRATEVLLVDPAELSACPPELQLDLQATLAQLQQARGDNAAELASWANWFSRLSGASQARLPHLRRAVQLAQELQADWMDSARERLYQWSLELLGPDHPDTLAAAQHQLDTYLEEKNWARAEPLLRAQLVTQQQDRPAWLKTQALLAQVLRAQAKAEEAWQAYSELFRGQALSDEEQLEVLRWAYEEAQGELAQELALDYLIRLAKPLPGHLDLYDYAMVLAEPADQLRLQQARLGWAEALAAGLDVRMDWTHELALTLEAQGQVDEANFHWDRIRVEGLPKKALADAHLREARKACSQGQPSVELYRAGLMGRLEQTQWEESWLQDALNWARLETEQNNQVTAGAILTPLLEQLERRSLEGSPSYCEALYLKARLAYLQEQTEPGRDLLEQAFELWQQAHQPEGLGALMADFALEQSIAARSQADYERWAARLEKLGIEPRPFERGFDLEAMQALHHSGDWGRLEQELREALPKLGAESPEEHFVGYLWLAESLEQQGQWNASLEFRQQNQAFLTDRLGAAHPLVLRGQMQLGQCLNALSRFSEGERVLAQSVRAHEKAFGADSLPVGRVLLALAESFRLQGKDNLMEAVSGRAVGLLEKHLPVGHPERLQAKRDMVQWMMDQGRFAEARQQLQFMEQEEVQAYGADHPELAVTLSQWASLETAEGDYASAEAHYRRSLDLFERGLGDSHPNVAATLNNLGQNLYRQANYGEAASVLERALKIFDAYDAGRVSTMVNLGLVWQAQQEHSRAQQWLEEALRVSVEWLGEDDLEVAFCCFTLAEVLASQEQMPQARQYAQRALDIRERRLGALHPETSTSQAQVSNLLLRDGREADAIPLVEGSLRIQAQALGEDHPELIPTYSTLGRLYMVAERWDQAEETLLKAIGLISRSTAQVSAELAQRVAELGELRASQGDLEQAIGFSAKAVEILVEALGTQHEAVDPVMLRLAKLYLQAARFKEAETCFKRVLDQRTQRLGGEDPLVALVWLELAELQLAQGRQVLAETLGKKALDLIQKRFGSDHVQLRPVLEFLARHAQKQGNDAQLLAYQQQLEGLVEPAVPEEKSPFESPIVPVPLPDTESSDRPLEASAQADRLELVTTEQSQPTSSPIVSTEVVTAPHHLDLPGEVSPQAELSSPDSSEVLELPANLPSEQSELPEASQPDSPLSQPELSELVPAEPPAAIEPDGVDSTGLEAAEGPSPFDNLVPDQKLGSENFPAPEGEGGMPDWLTDDAAEAPVVAESPQAVAEPVAVEPPPPQPEPVAVEPVPPQAEPEPESVEPPPPQAEPEPVAVEPPPPQAEPEPVAVEPPPPQAEPEPVAVEPSPPQAEPEPVAVETPPPQAEPEPVAVEPAPAVVEAEPVPPEPEPEPLSPEQAAQKAAEAKNWVFVKELLTPLIAQRNGVDLAEILRRLALAERHLGNRNQAERYLLQSITLWSQEYGENHPELADSMGDLAEVSFEMGKLEQAEGLLRRATEIQVRLHGTDHVSMIPWLLRLGRIYLPFKAANALAPLQRAANLAQNRLGATDPVQADILWSLAQAHEQARDLDEAIVCLRRRLAFPDAEEALEVSLKLGQLLLRVGQIEAATQILHKLEVHLPLPGPEIEEQVKALLGSIMVLDDRLEEAEPRLLEALQMRTQRLSTQHPELRPILCNLALLYSRREAYQQVAIFAQQALELTPESEHETRLQLYSQLAPALMELDRRSEAESTYRNWVALIVAQQGENHPAQLPALQALSKLLQKRGDSMAAQDLREKAWQILSQSPQVSEAEFLLPLEDLARGAIEQAAWDKAEAWLRRAYAIAEKQDGLAAARLAFALGEVFRATGRLAEAETAIRRSLEFRQTALGAEHVETLRSLQSLAEVYSAQNRYEAAQSMLSRCLDAGKQTLGEQHPDLAGFHRALGVLWSHTGRMEEAEKSLLQALELVEKVSPPHPELVPTLEALGQYYQRLDQLAQAAPFYSRALDSMEQSLGPSHLAVADSLLQLGELQQRQGNFEEAERHFRRCLEIRSQKLAPQSPRLAQVRQVLAQLLQKQGHTQAARELFEQALAALWHEQGGETAQVAECLEGLGLLELQQGLYAESEARLQKALTIREKESPDRQGPSMQTHQLLARVFLESRRPEMAERSLKRALEIAQKVYGGDRPEVAACLEQLGGLYLNQGRYVAAEALFDRALEIRERSQQPQHPDSGYCLLGLAQIYLAQNQLTQAWQTAETAKTIYESLPQQPNLEQAQALYLMAETLRLQGRYKESEALYQRCLEIRNKLLGNDHPEVQRGLHGLGVSLMDQGKAPQAERIFTHALRLLESKLGNDHPDLANSLHSLGLLHRSQGRGATAELHLKRAMELRSKGLGSEHPDLAASLQAMAQLHLDQRNDQAAEALLKQALSIREKALRADHPALSGLLLLLAGLYKSQERFAEAEPRLKRVLDQREKLLGTHHPDTAAILQELGELYLLNGQLPQAETLLKRALDIYEKRLGQEHPTVLPVLHLLWKTYDAQKRAQEAAGVRSRIQLLEVTRPG
ncbi:MAG: tetratricopeptide repeat protein [Vulcanimicrobiota bacterium]